MAIFDIAIAQLFMRSMEADNKVCVLD
jgi:hypothetical protein